VSQPAKKPVVTFPSTTRISSLESAFQRKRHPDNAASFGHKTRPKQTEFEGKNRARDRPDREENRTASRPALGQLQVNRAPGSKIHSFRKHHQYRKPDADGRENDVERQRQRHLRPGKEKIAHW